MLHTFCVLLFRKKIYYLHYLILSLLAFWIINYHTTLYMSQKRNLFSDCLFTKRKENWAVSDSYNRDLRNIFTNFIFGNKAVYPNKRKNKRINKDK